MKRFRFVTYLFLIVFSSGIILNACKTATEDGNTSSQYYLANETKLTLTVDQIKTNLNGLVPNFSAMFGSVIKSDVEVQKVTYQTTFRNTSIKASGLVCFPKNTGTYPILSFQNGTNTVLKDAPSENPEQDNILMIESLAATGFIVVIPDYIGFGESAGSPHPYLDTKSMTQSVIDLIRAAKELGNSDKVVAKPTKGLFLFGYSQGGWVTLQTQRSIEKNYSSEFNLIASSCGAGPYSVEYLTDYVLRQDTYPMPYFLADVLNSYINIGSISNPLTDFFQPAYATKIPGLFDGLHNGSQINAQLTGQIANLLTSDFMTSYSASSKFATFKSVIKSSSVEAWSLSTPTKLFHGADDVYIPIGVSQKMYADFLAKDPNNVKKLDLIPIPLTNHTTAVPLVAFETISWFLQIK